MEQLCWKCVKCTNSNLCKWAIGELPQDVKIKDNFITHCPNFEKDIEAVEFYKIQKNFKNYIQNKLNISDGTYYEYAKYVKNKTRFIGTKFKEFAREYDYYKEP